MGLRAASLLRKANTAKKITSYSRAKMIATGKKAATFSAETVGNTAIFAGTHSLLSSKFQKEFDQVSL